MNDQLARFNKINAKIEGIVATTIEAQKTIAKQQAIIDNAARQYEDAIGERIGILLEPTHENHYKIEKSQAENGIATHRVEQLIDKAGLDATNTLNSLGIVKEEVSEVIVADLMLEVKIHADTYFSCDEQLTNALTNQAKKDAIKIRAIRDSGFIVPKGKL